MLKRLFTEQDFYTPEAHEFDKEVISVLKPLIKKWTAQDYSTRDIEHMIIGLTVVLCGEIRLERGLKARLDKKRIK